MNIEIIKRYHWRKILTRPFSLFGVSIWNEWYASDFTNEIFGFKTSKGLFIEHSKGTAIHYREKKELKKIEIAVRENFKSNPSKFDNLLKEGKTLNERAKRAIKQNPFNNVKDAVNFLTRLALLSTILPYIIGEIIEKKKIVRKIMLYSMMLRGISLYPKVIKRVVEPLVEKELSDLGIKEKEAYFLITYKELLRKDTSNLKRRLFEIKEGKKFVYLNLDGKESIFWMANPEEVIKLIEETNKEKESEIKGSIAYPGIVRGKARIIFSDNLSQVNFHKGEIIVAPSTNPNLTPIIKIAAAIVTDEGGIMSHASIISRELKIPCIVGTGKATKILKEGDLIEVNADKGTVRILKR